MDFIDKAQKLPANIKSFFFSNASRLEIERCCFMYEISESAIQNISGPIGLIFTKDIELKTLPHIILENLHLEKGAIYGIAFEINTRIFARFPEYFTDAMDLMEEWQKLKTPPVISEDEAWEKVLELEPWILENEKEEQEAKKELRDNNVAIQSAIEKIKIQEALEKFPEVGEQLITSNHLKLKSFPEPARPSIKNWLSDYTFTLGYDSHSAMDRGTYLFRNENAKVLNSIDRERLSFLLKNYDENSLVDINTNTKQIVFPRRETKVTKINEQKTTPTTFNSLPKKETLLNKTPSSSINNLKNPKKNISSQVKRPEFETPKQAPPRHQEIYPHPQATIPHEELRPETDKTPIPSAKKLNFTSPQKMAYEKQTIHPAQQSQKPPQAQPPRPMRISSQNLRDDDVEETSQNGRRITAGNIVNLKDSK
jgi:hypothetical protein